MRRPPELFSPLALLHRLAARLLLAAATLPAALLTPAARAHPGDASESANRFLAARPVWPEGRSREKNLFVGFRAVLDLEEIGDVDLRLTASTVYRASVNGRHTGYGPARGPHGHYRIDVWNLSPQLRPGRNVVAVEVAGYNVNSYYTLDQPSFLMAEVVRNGVAVAATGEMGFEAALLPERLQKVQRYSFQRPFSEVYRVAPGHGRWKSDPDVQLESVACAPDPRTLELLPRRVPYPIFHVRREVRAIGGGTVSRLDSLRRPWKDRSLTAIGPKLKGFPESELEIIPSLEMQHYVSRPATPAATGPSGRRGSPGLSTDEYRILDLGTNLTGFVGLRVQCETPTRLVVAFDEVLRDGDVDFKRLGCVNLLWYELPAGTTEIESFEPYTLRYLKTTVLEGSCEILDVYLREYACPRVDGARFRSSDPRLEKLFEAGRETFRQNTLDTFMDCPSRERAGWLCDSFFTARVAPDLRGETTVEEVLFENYLLAERFEFLPTGMLPMCYPADHNDGVYIPNWAMWFVIQLEEYLERSGDRRTVDRLRPRVLALLDFLARFRNSDGLLEKLPSWVFIEWSDANKYVQDINYPSNMLYAAVLEVVGRLYGRKDLERDAERLRGVIREQAFDGAFFVDNALRSRDGKLEVTRNRTEVCQYFAFFFGIATPQTHSRLWETLRDDFGPGRRTENPHPDIGMANSFIGNMLRIELLSRAGLSQQILDESIEYLLYMAERTGTLWENVGDYASCNHGFASHIVHTLLRDVLGARELDRRGRRLQLRFAPLDLDWCEGTLPTPEGPVTIEWRRRGKTLEVTWNVPEGYTVEIENRSGLELRGKNAGGAGAGNGARRR